MYNINNQKGVSIYIGLMIMAILLTIVFGLNGILVSQIKTVRNIGYSVVAFYAAETGIEEALFNSSTCTSVCSMSGVLDIGSAYTIQGYATGTGGCPLSGVDYCIKSVGTYNQTKRGVQIAR